MSNLPFYTRTELDGSIAKLLDQIEARLEAFGFAIWPINGDLEHGIPSGFSTIGMTKIGLPEIYVSGISPNSRQAENLINGLRDLHAHTRDTTARLTPFELCMEVNMGQGEDATPPAYQWRPVDPTRMMYGQCLAMRHWAEARGLVDKVQGIQIVHRADGTDFPMESTPNQLLLDWVPFGSKGVTFDFDDIQPLNKAD